MLKYASANCQKYFYVINYLFYSLEAPAIEFQKKLMHSKIF